MSLDLTGLNPQQAEAVLYGDGPLLIFAGAGSGKTRVLTMRIAHLISERNISPGAILAMTFTNKAAREMSERITETLGESPLGLWAGTFHSNCVRLLRRDIEKLGIWNSHFVIADEDDSRQTMKRALQEIGRDPKVFPPGPILERISKAKSELVAYEKVTGEGSLERVFLDAAKKYDEILRRENRLDFDDILVTTVRLLEQNAEARDFWQRRFRYVLVDEYQDTNHAQYALLRLLSDFHRNLTVVGDDDQSIYRFRGADIRNILDFERDFPNAHIVKLEQNYRSTQKILDTAYCVISNNPERAPKRLWTDRGAGDNPTVLLAFDDRQEADLVVREIARLSRDEGRSWSDFALLYRTNAQSRSFEQLLNRWRIPYRIVGGVRFWERQEIKDALAYIRFLFNPSDGPAFVRLAQVPRRGVSEKTAQVVVDSAIKSGQSIMQVLEKPEGLQLRPQSTKALASLRDEIKGMQGLVNQPTSQFIDELLRTLDLKPHYEHTDKDSEIVRDRMTNLAELRGMAKDFDELPYPSGLETFLAESVLSSDVDKLLDPKDAVTLITLHMVKGLEFPVVFLTGMEEETLPFAHSLHEPGGVDEERRLCYVGITRAKDRLYLSAVNRRTFYGTTNELQPSRFLEEIDPLLLRLGEAPGHHSDYLAGQIKRAHRLGRSL